MIAAVLSGFILAIFAPWLPRLRCLAHKAAWVIAVGWFYTTRQCRWQFGVVRSTELWRVDTITFAISPDSAARAGRRVEIVAPWVPACLYGLAFDGLNLLARAQARLLQSVYLRFYLMIIIATTVGLVVYTLASNEQLNGVVRQPGEARFYEIVVAVLILIAAIVVTRTQSRLAAVAALGVVGYGVALIFIFSARRIWPKRR
ncbi:MAG: hypothetical protein ONB44_22960 [candidate division KSB1 bacterium]|nr:hypothetical protein [candidate division KSB1 bacterium]MDZ7314043.1 hypothetical protein [candidate division KSB1 bacterium]